MTWMWSSCGSTGCRGTEVSEPGEARGREAPVIELDRFSVEFPGFLFKPLSLCVEPGARIALLGANGAGKSTLLRALGGRLPDYRGKILLGGTELRERLLEHRTQVGLLPEKITGTPDETVSGRLSLISALYPSWDPEYAARLLARLDLSGDAGMATLSKGMGLKYSFVAAEAYRPPILLLDEPTSGLDPVVRREFLALLGEVMDHGLARTLIVSTHLLEDVEAFADRVWVLRDGRMVEDTPLAALDPRGSKHGLSQILYDVLDRPYPG
ncbi:MAG: ABC transporter ATP-binding protein [Gemmatimonadales bacterium]|nr:MAG: ABC transporter ATP-binding protein [Gemmatimonadales bacterium]